MNSMPAYKEFFKQDIVKNIKKKTVDYKRNIYLPDLIDEAIYYAADMCLEFYAKSGHVLPQNWIDHIVEETCVAFRELFKEFDNTTSEHVHDNVNLMMKNKAAARNAVDNYYAFVNKYYAEHY